MQVIIEDFGYEEPLEIEDHSDKEWKANYANLKKLKISELKELCASPHASMRIMDIIREILSKRNGLGE